MKTDYFIKNPLSSVILFLCIGGGIFLAFGVIVLNDIWELGCLDEYANYGNAFGFLASFFTLCTFSCAMGAIMLQNKQLLDGRDAFLRERFENTFFSMTKSLREIAQEIELSANGDCLKKGIASFKYFYDEAETHIHITGQDVLEDRQGV